MDEHAFAEHFGSASQALYLVVDNQIVWANRAFERLAGPTPRPLVGMQLRYEATLEPTTLEVALCPPPEARSTDETGAVHWVEVPRGAAAPRRCEIRWLALSPQPSMLLAAIRPVQPDEQPPDLRWQLHELQQHERTALRWDSVTSRSPLVRHTLEQARLVSANTAPVFIWGDQGTHKTSLARAIHDRGRMRAGPFVVLDIESLPRNIIGRELWGHVAGAAYGREEARLGAYRGAHGGTLVVRHWDQLPAEIQSQWREVLEGDQVTPIGSNRPEPVRVRVMVTSRVSPSSLAKSPHIHASLLQTISLQPIHVPPLQERREDIPLLVQSVLDQFNSETGAPVERVAESAWRVLEHYSWPGNTTELESVIRRACERCEDHIITAAHLPAGVRAAVPDAEGRVAFPSQVGLAELTNACQRELVEWILASARGNKTAAAELAQVSRIKLYRLLENHAIDPRAVRLPRTTSALVQWVWEWLDQQPADETAQESS